MCEQVQLDKLVEHLDVLHRRSALIEIVERGQVLARLVGISFYQDGYGKVHRNLAIQDLRANARYNLLCWPHLKIITKDGNVIAALTTMAD